MKSTKCPWFPFSVIFCPQNCVSFWGKKLKQKNVCSNPSFLFSPKTTRPTSEYKNLPFIILKPNFLFFRLFVSFYFSLSWRENAQMLFCHLHLTQKQEWMEFCQMLCSAPAILLNRFAKSNYFQTK